MKRLQIEVALAALLWTALADAQGISGEPKECAPGVEGAPASASSLRNPYEGDPEAVAAGRKLYAIHCSRCHGERGEGWRNAPSLMSDEVHQASPGAVFWYLTNGDLRRGMPAWSRLPQARRWQLESFLRGLSAPE